MSIRHAVLGLLAEQPLSGYDLLKRFNSSFAFIWSAHQSQVYTELGHLERSGLIEVVGEGPRHRKEYAITQAGEAELRHWVVDVEPSDLYRNDEMLRVFFLWLVSPEEAASYFDEMRIRSEGRLAQLEALRATIPWDESPHDRYSQMALSFGISRMRALAEWAATQGQLVSDHDLNRGASAPDRKNSEPTSDRGD